MLLSQWALHWPLTPRTTRGKKRSDIMVCNMVETCYSQHDSNFLGIGRKKKDWGTAECQLFLGCSVLSLSKWGHIGPHIVPLYKIQYNFQLKSNFSYSTTLSLQFLRDVCVAVLFAVCYQEIFLSVLAAGIPLLGCVSRFFSPSNKEDSGVLTFTWMTGALHTLHF